MPIVRKEAIEEARLVAGVDAAEERLAAAKKSLRKQSFQKNSQIIHLPQNKPYNQAIHLRVVFEFKHIQLSHLLSPSQCMYVGKVV